MSRRIRFISAVVLAGVATFCFLNVWAQGFAIGDWTGLPGYEGSIKRAERAFTVWWYAAWVAEILAVLLFFLKKRQESVPGSSSQSFLTMSLVDKSWSLTGAEYAARGILAILYAAFCNVAFFFVFYWSGLLIERLRGR